MVRMNGIRNIEVFEQLSKFSANNKASSLCDNLSCRTTNVEIQRLSMENFELYMLELRHYFCRGVYLKYSNCRGTPLL